MVYMKTALKSHRIEFSEKRIENVHRAKQRKYMPHTHTTRANSKTVLYNYQYTFVRAVAFVGFIFGLLFFIIKFQHKARSYPLRENSSFMRSDARILQNKMNAKKSKEGNNNNDDDENEAHNNMNNHIKKRFYSLDAKQWCQWCSAFHAIESIARNKMFMISCLIVFFFILWRFCVGNYFSRQTLLQLDSNNEWSCFSILKVSLFN